jgi:hypothetical protein
MRTTLTYFFLVTFGRVFRKGFWAKLERNTFQCFSESKVANVVGLRVRAKNNLAKRFYITIKIPFVTGIPVTKTRSTKIQLISATRTSFCNRGECRREMNRRFSEKSLNLENSLNLRFGFPRVKRHFSYEGNEQFLKCP